MDDFIQRVAQAIARHHLLADDETVVVGTSGGVDSMVLLHVLRTLCANRRWRIVVAHFNHQLRGKDADADERFVMNAAKKLRLPFAMERRDVKAFARASGLSLEMAARKLRHEFLARTAEAAGSRYIALAHHADDQVELFFVRLLRGSGAQGLGGMKWKAPCPAAREATLVRPLLDESKTVLVEFARAHRVRFREDATNRSADILRNRIRHKLLPLLRRDYQRAIDTAVLRSMELISDESDFLSAEAGRWLKNRSRSSFDALHAALQRRIVQAGLLAHGVVPQFEHIEHLRMNPNRWLTARADFV
ncbi:MAG TPA: tRNA lysidine(34) synthetase TilS, partial [Verrucomicrobiae bacterium]